MSKTAPALESAIDAVRKLPENTQEAIASTIIEEVEAYSKSFLTEAQHASVIESLNKPHKFVSAETVAQTLRRYQQPA